MLRALLISAVAAFATLCSPTEQLSDGACLYSTDSKYISVGDRADSASVAEVFGEPRRVTRFTDDEALCGEVELVEYDSMSFTLLDGRVWDFGTWRSGAVMSIGGLPIEVGMAHAEIEVGAKFEHRYFEERGCGYIFMRQEDGSLWDDYLIYTIENERVASLTWHVPI